MSLFRLYSKVENKEYESYHKRLKENNSVTILKHKITLSEDPQQSKNHKSNQGKLRLANSLNEISYVLFYYIFNLVSSIIITRLQDYSSLCYAKRLRTLWIKERRSHDPST